MAQRKLKRRNYGREWPVSIKYQNLHSFKEGLILLSQSIVELRGITYLHGFAHFAIPLSHILGNNIPYSFQLSRGLEIKILFKGFHIWAFLRPKCGPR